MEDAPNQNRTVDWTPVDEALAEGTASGAKLAVLEAGKILESSLANAKLPGDTPAAKLGKARGMLARPAEVTQLQQALEKLHRGDSPALSPEQAKHHVQTVRQTLADLSSIPSADRSPATRIKLLAGMFRGRRQLGLQVLGAATVAFVLILFLADTPPGQAIVTGVVGIVHFFFRWLLGLVILLAVLAAAVAATALYLDRRQADPKIKGE